MAVKGVRVVFFADSHLGYDYPLRPRVERRHRGNDFFANFQRVLDYGARTRPDLVVHGGDFFFRSRVPPPIVAMAYERLARFAEGDIPLLIVPGNHERSRLPASLWLAHPGIGVFDRPRTYHLDAAGATLAVSGFPFAGGDVRDRFRALLDQTGWQDDQADITLLAMHQIVEGARVGPSGYTFRSGEQVIRRSDVPHELAAVLAGHVHRAQVLTGPAVADRPPVVYAGSIERTSFAERGEAKGFYDLTFAPDEAGRWRLLQTDFVALPTRPMVDLEVDPKVGPQSLRDHLRGRAASFDPDAVVRLTAGGELDPSVRAALTAAFLRSAFPPSMSVQVSRALWPENVEALDVAP